MTKMKALRVSDSHIRPRSSSVWDTRGVDAISFATLAHRSGPSG